MPTPAPAYTPYPATVTAFSIDRSKWSRGHYPLDTVTSFTPSELLIHPDSDTANPSSNGPFCAMGFFGQAMGFTVNELSGIVDINPNGSPLLQNFRRMNYIIYVEVLSSDTPNFLNYYQRNALVTTNPAYFFLRENSPLPFNFTAANLNDISITILSNTLRESKLQELFSINGIALTFTGSYISDLLT